MTFKHLVRSSLILAAAFAAAPTLSNAQTGHENHDHSDHQTMREAPLPKINNVLTESPDDHVIGSKTAPITIIAYASVTCPHCGKWFTEEWPTFKAEQVDTGNVRFIMREFPTAPEDIARAGFAIINCAPESEFFDHLSAQMTGQKEVLTAIKEERVEPIYEEFAKKAGMATREAFVACLSDIEIQSQIDRAVLRAQAARINSVPSFLMDGDLIKTDNSAEGLSVLVNAKLSGGVTDAFTGRPKNTK